MSGMLTNQKSFSVTCAMLFLRNVLPGIKVVCVCLPELLGSLSLDSGRLS